MQGKSSFLCCYSSQFLAGVTCKCLIQQNPRAVWIALSMHFCYFETISAHRVLSEASCQRARGLSIWVTLTGPGWSQRFPGVWEGKPPRLRARGWAVSPDLLQARVHNFGILLWALGTSISLWRPGARRALHHRAPPHRAAPARAAAGGARPRARFLRGRAGASRLHSSPCAVKRRLPERR